MAGRLIATRATNEDLMAEVLVFWLDRFRTSQLDLIDKWIHTNSKERGSERDIGVDTKGISDCNNKLVFFL